MPAVPQRSGKGQRIRLFRFALLTYRSQTQTAQPNSILFAVPKAPVFSRIKHRVLEDQRCLPACETIGHVVIDWSPTSKAAVEGPRKIRIPSGLVVLRGHDVRLSAARNEDRFIT
jgi:hypothetical protein